MLDKLENWYKLKKFMFLCGVKKEDTQQQINEKVISYVKKNPNKEYNIVLTDEQRNDPNFMLDFYNIIPSYCIQSRFSPSKELKNDVDFMVEVFKIAIKADEKENTQFDWNSEYLAGKNIDLFQNDEFLKKLSNKTNANIITLFKNAIWHSPARGSIKELIENLPEGVLVEQCRKHGSKTLQYIPKENENLPKYVSAGIEKDGFDSLEYLPLKDVLDNKDLVIKAYAMEGFDELKMYIEQTLKPGQYVDYMCHGEPHSMYRYSEERELVQESLLNDPEIKRILEKHNSKPVKQVKTEVEYIL